MNSINIKVAALTLLGALATTNPLNAHPSSETETIEVAFVLDTTGSMGELIAGAKQKIWSIANTIVDINPNSEIRMALVGFRDFGDDYVIKKFDLSDDIQGLYGNLTRFEAAGGGDTPEAVNEALHEAVANLNWQGQHKKIIFLVGDSPPHMDYNGPKYPQIVKTARDKDILINTVQAGNNAETARIWRDIAQHGNGEFVVLPQNGGKLLIIETPYDDAIRNLQMEIDRTVISYGDLRERKRVQRLLQEKASANVDTAIGNAKFYSKRHSKPEAITGGGDLVGDVRNGTVALPSLAEKELPDEIKFMSTAERKAHIDGIIEKRIELEEKMTALVRQHDVYVAKWREKNAADGVRTFDNSVSRVLKQQLSGAF